MYCFALILGPFSYSFSLESLFQIFLGVFSRIFNPTCVTIMITCCQQAHGHCRFFFWSPCIPLLQELEQERQQVFQKEQQIHQRMEKCTEESPSQTTKIVFILNTRFVFAKIVFLLSNLQTVVVCNKRYLSAVLWIRRYPWMESELESLFSGHYQIGWFQTEDNIPKVSSLFVWVVWRRKCLEMLTIHWHTVGMFGSFAGRQCTFLSFWTLDLKLEVSWLQRLFGAVYTWLQPSGGQVLQLESWRTTEDYSQEAHLNT